MNHVNKPREYKTSTQKRLNQQRAEQQQPKLITPNGWGTYTRSWGGKEGRS